MNMTFYGRFHGAGKFGQHYAEVYKSTQDDGLTLDERVEARRCWTLRGAKRWVEKTILKYCCANRPQWFYVDQDKLLREAGEYNIEWEVPLTRTLASDIIEK